MELDLEVMTAVTGCGAVQKVQASLARTPISIVHDTVVSSTSHAGRTTWRIYEECARVWRGNQSTYFTADH